MLAGVACRNNSLFAFGIIRKIGNIFNFFSAVNIFAQINYRRFGVADEQIINIIRENILVPEHILANLRCIVSAENNFCVCLSFQHFRERENGDKLTQIGH